MTGLAFWSPVVLGSVLLAARRFEMLHPWAGYFFAAV